MDNAYFFTFFTTLDLIWQKFCPKTTPGLILFGLVSSELCSGIQLIDIFGPTCAKMGSPWATSKTENNFFSEITKPDHTLS